MVDFVGTDTLQLPWVRTSGGSPLTYSYYISWSCFHRNEAAAKAAARPPSCYLLKLWRTAEQVEVE